MQYVKEKNWRSPKKLEERGREGYFTDIIVYR